MKFFAIVLVVLASLLLAAPALGERNFPATRNKCVNGDGMLVSTHSPHAVGGECPTA
jgi:hypothetical protein